MTPNVASKYLIKKKEINRSCVIRLIRQNCSNQNKFYPLLSCWMTYYVCNVLTILCSPIGRQASTLSFLAMRRLRARMRWVMRQRNLVGTRPDTCSIFSRFYSNLKLIYIWFKETSTYNVFLPSVITVCSLSAYRSSEQLF